MKRNSKLIEILVDFLGPEKCSVLNFKNGKWKKMKKTAIQKKILHGSLKKFFILHQKILVRIEFYH
jgi:hypothetical protein